MPTDEEQARRLYAHIARDLSYHADGVASYETVVRLVEEVREDLDRRSRIKTYLPLLVERQALEIIRDCVRRPAPLLAERPVTRPATLLYVCTRSAGRTQLAAALTRRLVGTRVHVVTAGSVPSSVVGDEVRHELDRIGSPAEHPIPILLTDSVVASAEVVVSLGAGDAVPLVPTTWYREWDVLSPDGQDGHTVRSISAELERRIVDLIGQLGFDQHVALRRRSRSLLADRET